MRISDWSSDVCSSDLQAVIIAVAAEEHSLVRRLCGERHEMLAVMVAEILRAGRREHGVGKIAAGARRRGRAVEQGRTPRRADPAFARNRLVDDSDQRQAVDRQSVVWGKSVSVRVDPRGPRSIKKNKN